MSTITTDKIIKNAERFCAEHGHRLTEPRAHVLDILVRADSALTAYEILDKLGQYLDHPKPPTAYRAIEFWVTHGFAHRIESLNAYVACAAGHKHAGSQFLICNNCHKVTEAHICTMSDSLSGKANYNDFKVESWSVELHGQCGTCNARG